MICFEQRSSFHQVPLSFGTEATRAVEMRSLNLGAPGVPCRSNMLPNTNDMLPAGLARSRAALAPDAYRHPSPLGSVGGTCSRLARPVGWAPGQGYPLGARVCRLAVGSSQSCPGYRD